MENATCHLYFPRIHTRLIVKARVYTKNTSDAWHIPRYPTRKYCITSVLCCTVLCIFMGIYFNESRRILRVVSLMTD